MGLKRNFTFEPHFFINYELRITNYELQFAKKID
jgi:hypothetical protein